MSGRLPISLTFLSRKVPSFRDKSRLGWLFSASLIIYFLFGYNMDIMTTKKGDSKMPKNEPDLDKMAKALKKGIDDNAQDTPRLNIDPDSQKMAAVGDPNNIKPANKPYSLVFIYPANAVSEEDKLKMIYLKETDEYGAVSTYPNVRVKPLHRTKVALVVTDIMRDLGVLTQEGYSSDNVDEVTAHALTNHLPELAELAELVLDIPSEQVKYLNAGCLYEFFNTLLENEPNILQEGSNFLSSSQLLAMARK